MARQSKQERRERRRGRIRARVFGTAVRPRASVFRSLRGVSVQLIDDATGHTLLSVSSLALPHRRRAGAPKTVLAEAVGRQMAQEAQALGITHIVFDRSGFRYHGRVKALAEALRAGGLKF